MRNGSPRIDQRPIMICDLNSIVMLNGNFGDAMVGRVSPCSLYINNSVHLESENKLS